MAQNTMAYHNIRFNEEYKKFTSMEDGYAKIDVIDNMLISLQALAAYEQQGLFEAEPSAAEMLEIFKNGKELLLNKIGMDHYLEIELKIKNGTDRKTLLSSLNNYRTTILA